MFDVCLRCCALSVFACYKSTKHLLRRNAVEPPRLAHQLFPYIRHPLPKRTQCGRRNTLEGLISGGRDVQEADDVGVEFACFLHFMGKALLAGLTSEQLRALYPDRVLPVMTPHSLRAFDDLELELTAVRAMGCAFEREESTMGTACAAAPIRDVTGQIVAAISVALPLERWDASPRSRWVSVVQDAAAGLSASLGHV